MRSRPAMEAKWWEHTENGRIVCTLCPRYCELNNGQSGFCYVRKNIDNKLYNIAYGKPTGFSIDPIEKKPLNHFYPGSNILSFGTAGCNLGCKFCQNWSISKAKLDDINSLDVTPEEVVELAIKHNTPSIAFTYNDPTIFGEYVIDISKIAKEENINSVMVTAGYIDQEARKDVYKYIDAVNVDLKAFSEMFYKKLTLSSLAPVLNTLKWLKNETDIWIEITTLLIPNENDSDEEIISLSNWVLENLGDSIPIHFTAFHPDFKLRDKTPTPPQTLIRARQIALREGIKYCYVGNVNHTIGQTTYCKKCNEPLIIRDWHSVLNKKLDNGKCFNCNEVLDGVF